MCKNCIQHTLKKFVEKMVLAEAKDRRSNCKKWRPKKGRLFFTSRLGGMGSHIPSRLSERAFFVIGCVHVSVR